MSETAITVTGLRKSFGDNTVLDGIDFEVPRGTVYALLGPNGAGKTTTVRILATLDRADAGEIRVADRRVEEYSGGMTRRLDLAMTLVSDPQIIFLDEPTTGLDPRSRHAVWDRVRALVDGGTTVFLTTQYLDEADQLADHIAVLDQGRIVAEGTAAQLKRLVPGGHISLEFADTATMERAREQFPTAVVDTRAGTHVLAVPGDGGSDALRAILQTLDTAGLEATGLSVHTPGLDDVFLTLTGRAAA